MGLLSEERVQCQPPVDALMAAGRVLLGTPNIVLPLELSVAHLKSSCKGVAKPCHNGRPGSACLELPFINPARQHVQLRLVEGRVMGILQPPKDVIDLDKAPFLVDLHRHRPYLVRVHYVDGLSSLHELLSLNAFVVRTERVTEHLLRISRRMRMENLSLLVRCHDRLYVRRELIMYLKQLLLQRWPSSAPH